MDTRQARRLVEAALQSVVVPDGFRLTLASPESMMPPHYPDGLWVAGWLAWPDGEGSTDILDYTAVVARVVANNDLQAHAQTLVDVAARHFDMHCDLVEFGIRSLGDKAGGRCFYDAGAGRCVLPLNHKGAHRAPQPEGQP